MSQRSAPMTAGTRALGLVAAVVVAGALAAWAFAWAVNATSTTVNELTVDDTVDDPLAYWGNAILECVLERIKPAHTYVVFAYV